MKRRDFIMLVGGLMTRPHGGTAQQSNRMFTIGILSASSPNSTSHLYTAFFKALRELGWIEGSNVIFEQRYADNRTERLPELAVGLVRLKIDLIVAIGTLEARAAKQATSTIPIIIPVAGDPIAEGLITSLPLPGGNITGMSYMSPELGPKRLQVFKEVLPAFSRVAIPWNSAIPAAARVTRETEDAARILGIEVSPIAVRNAGELDNAYALIRRQRPDALVVVQDFLTLSYRKQIAVFALKHRIPSMHSGREFAEAGGLMSYGPDLVDLVRRAAGYADRILNGTRPAGLPVE
jgi:putative tryptophan/tyrosine transport system substrate-binding protein